MEQAEKIGILLAEYGSLRSEIIARMNHGYQLLSVAIAGIAIISVFQQARWMLFAASFAIGVIFFIGSWLVWRDLRKLARRVQGIELDVNSRAGEHLLVWETLWRGLSWWGNRRRSGV
jgi:predicted lysophospholipase L1 biosynthesis ABC-type transport system permease subunit